MGGLSLPIGFLAGWMMDRLGRRRWLIPGYLATGVAIALVGVTAVLHLSVAWFVAGYLGVFAAQALTSGSIQTIGADVAPAEARGFFLGVWNFANQGGSAAGPVTFAFLAQEAGYPLAFVVLGAVTVSVAVMFLTYIPETSGRPIRRSTAG
jgi:MFS family permease